MFCDVPDCVLRLIFMILTKGPLDMAKYRMGKISQWRNWLEELASQERTLHDNMDTEVGMVLKSKNILLLERIAKDLDWPDRAIFTEMSQGFYLTGIPKPTGVFLPEAALPTMTVEQLEESNSIIKMQLWDRISNAEADPEVWDITVKEAEDNGWLSAPMNFEQLEQKMGSNWVPVRRFGIQQSGKTRVIDDFSENGTNSAFAAQEKIDLKALDHLAWCGATLAKAAFVSRTVDLKLSDGSRLSGPVHSLWNPATEKILTKTVDLKSAYKQLAIHPLERRRSVICIKDPKSGRVFGFVSRTLPFGAAAAAVLAFNRVARLVWRILIEAGVLCTNYFDDYPVLDFSSTAGVTVHAIRSVMALLGFKCSVDKEMEFEERTDMLGVCVDTSKVSDGSVLISNKPSRVKNLSGNNEEVIRAGRIKSSDVARLFGRLQFAEHQLSGRIGKLALAELRHLQDCKGSVWFLDEDAKSELDLLKFRLCHHPPRKLNSCDPEVPVFVFPDGACEPADDGSYLSSVGGVLICGSVKQYFGGRLDGSLVNRWMDDKKNIIGLVELYAVVLARYHWDSLLRGRRVVFFVDNVPSMRSLIKGTSSEKQWRELLRRLEFVEMKGPTYSWFARVPSDSNIADGPSRDDFSGLEQFEATMPVCIFSRSLIQW
jgi:hypothetical protein